MDFIDLKTQYRRVRDSMGTRIQAVLDHGQYILGPETIELERRLAEYVGVKHCIGASSGTDTLLIALMAYGIGPGDEVITSPFTFIATGEMIALAGATTVFADIDPRTYNIDPALLEKAITPRTKAIMPVALYGQCADMDAINRIAAKHRIPVIEDAAQSFGALYHGKRSCAVCEVGSTSFFPSKPLGAYGDGGALFTNDDDLAKLMREIRVHGQDRRYHHPRLGINGRLDTLQAAILLAKLEVFDDEVAARARIGTRYSEMIAEAFHAERDPDAPRHDALHCAGLHQRLRAIHDRGGRSGESGAGHEGARHSHCRPLSCPAAHAAGVRIAGLARRQFPTGGSGGPARDQPADASLCDRGPAGERRAGAARVGAVLMRQVVLDTETTGLEPEQGHRIIEIGCVEIVNRRKTGRTFHRYLRPDRDIDRGAHQVHGLTNEFLAQQPRFGDIVEELLEFVRGAELIIHNAAFDLAFLDAELQRLPGPAMQMRTLCAVTDTLPLARRMHPGQRNSLDALCKRYAIDNSHRELHGALLDAQILLDVYLAMTGGQTALILGEASEVRVSITLEPLAALARPRGVLAHHPREHR